MLTGAWHSTSDQLHSLRLAGRHSRLQPDVCDRIHRLGIARRGCRAGARSRDCRDRNVNSGVQLQSADRQSSTIPVIIGNRPLPRLQQMHRAARTTQCLTVLTAEKTMPPEITLSPTLYVFNSASLVKPNAIEQLTVELMGYDVDIAVISESHLKKRHADSSVNINGYSLFRRDRARRKGGGVVIYVRDSLTAVVWSPIPVADPKYELLWVKVSHGHNTTLVGALYHPPVAQYQASDILAHIEANVLQIQNDFTEGHIILAGDFNALPDTEVIIRSGLMPIVSQPTRGNRYLDRVYVSDIHYDSVKVVRSTVKSDHMAIVAYSGLLKKTVNKTRTKHTFRKHTAEQHACFLRSVTPALYTVNPDGDVQEECDNFYSALLSLLDKHYPERSITVTSADPPYVTAAVKSMLRQKNKLMRSGHTEKAAALATKIGIAIKRYNSAELSRPDALTSTTKLWAKVRQLTGRCNSASSHSAAVSAESLNDHYATISTDSRYTTPAVKRTASIRTGSTHITEWRVFKTLDTLRPTATGPDNIPSWFLRIGAPVFAAPLADLLNMSLASSLVPTQWKSASIQPVPKVTAPLTPSDFRPISITSVISRILERMVVKDYIYPSLCNPPHGLAFNDQFAFQPTGSTTAALVYLLHIVTTLLENNPFVIIIALDFTKAFDSVRHSAVLQKFSHLDLPDHIYNWIESFFRDRFHCTRYNDQKSEPRSITASIIQGSAMGPASYVITASDLRSVTSGNLMLKYADDTYLIVPAINVKSCPAEITNIEKWARDNNLRLNHTKSLEIIFVNPRSRIKVAVPSSTVSGFTQVEHIKILGVTISRKFSVSRHVNDLLSRCSQSLFALRTLRQHGLPADALQVVFQAIIVNKLSYASPAWRGFVSADDQKRIEALLRRSTKFGYRSSGMPTFASLCDEADERLFYQVTKNTRHLLHPLLPPRRDRHYSLRQRVHDFELPDRTSELKNKNFMMRLLFK